MYECEICDLKKITMHDLETHMDTVHSTKSTSFTCMVCDFTADDEIKMEYHVKDVHKIVDTKNSKDVSFPLAYVEKDI